jgi:DNA modification methylase
MKKKLINNDCLLAMKEMPDNSIDAIVTDPPYGLSFMGKKWDYDVPSQEIWEECLRVLKPGGYLLSFAGTRTQHRMAVRIEDAGFEIRDMIAWIYGCLSEDTEILTINGWKHYHKGIGNNPVLCYNVATNGFEFHKPTKDYFYANQHPAYRIKSDKTDQIVSRNHRVLVERGGEFIFQRAEELQPEESVPVLESLPDLSKAISDYNQRTGSKEQGLSGLYQTQDREMEQRPIQNARKRVPSLPSDVQDKVVSNWGKILLSALFRKGKKLAQGYRSFRQGWLDSKKYGELSNQNDRGEKPCVEGWGNLFQETRELLTDKICSLSERIFGYGPQGRVCYGTPTNNGSISEALSIEGGSGASYQSQSAGQSAGKSNVVSEQPGTQTPRSTRATITEIEYKGNVWCVEVPTGAFVARRNGQIFITGNSGFPKSLSIGKAVDKLQGNERIKTGEIKHHAQKGVAVAEERGAIGGGAFGQAKDEELTKGTSEWEGWGTALKPALEPITVARKPIEGTVAENCLKWGVGGINIDGCRVENTGKSTLRPLGKSAYQKGGGIVNGGVAGMHEVESEFGGGHLGGRFPANLIHNGSDEVVGLFPQTKPTKPHSGDGGKLDTQNMGWGFKRMACELSDNGGSAARFFYCAKASKSERNRGLDEFEPTRHADRNIDNGVGGDNPRNRTNTPKKNFHPTVKPIALMEYLVKLVSKEGHTVLDPFMGSGSTGIACKKLGREFIGIELDADYCKIAEARINGYKVSEQETLL